MVGPPSDHRRLIARRARIVVEDRRQVGDGYAGGSPVFSAMWGSMTPFTRFTVVVTGAVSFPSLADLTAFDSGPIRDATFSSVPLTTGVSVPVASATVGGTSPTGVSTTRPTCLVAVLMAEATLSVASGPT